ncbi:MAG: hypothetical protein ABEJ90_04330 [Halobacterium sp.]
MTRGDAGASRAVAPAVGKALEAGIVVLFVGLLAATLFGSVVPDARDAAAGEVGERALQHAAASVERAVPEAGANATVERRVELPETIHRRGYRITARSGSLVLVHPDSTVGGRTPLVLPDRVRAVRGNWTDDDARVAVKPHPDGGLVVVLAEADR